MKIDFNNNYTFKLEKVSGVYLIKNSKTNKIYIGESLDIKERWKTHIRELRSSTHKNTAMQNDYNAYGEESFDFKLLQTYIDYNPVFTKAKIIILEDWWIKYYKNNGKKLYNIIDTLSTILDGSFDMYDESFNNIFSEKVKNIQSKNIVKIIDGIPYFEPIEIKHNKRTLTSQTTAVKKLKSNNTIPDSCTLRVFQNILVKLGVLEKIDENGYKPSEKYKEYIITKDYHHIKFTEEGFKLITELMNNYYNN